MLHSGDWAVSHTWLHVASALIGLTRNSERCHIAEWQKFPKIIQIVNITLWFVAVVYQCFVLAPRERCEPQWTVPYAMKPTIEFCENSTQRILARGVV